MFSMVLTMVCPAPAPDRCSAREVRDHFSLEQDSNFKMVSCRTVMRLCRYGQASLPMGPIVRLFVTIAFLFPVFLMAQNVRNVLVLHTYNANMTANRLWSEAFREIVGSDVRNQLYEEYFDNDRFPEDDDALTKRLRSKYAGKKMDLVVSLGRIPLTFVMRHGE